MKKNLLSFPFLALSIFAILLTSCSKEDNAINTIEGSWDVSSFRLDDEELIGVTFEDFALDFGTYQNSEGKVVMHTTSMGSTPNSNNGTYIMGDESGVISIKTNEDEIKYNYAITKSNLTLFGVDADGKTYSMVARR